MPYLLLLALLWLTSPALAQGFRCAGSQGIPTTVALPPGIAAKPAQATPSRTTGTRRALVLFARFKGEPVNPVPSWAGDIFNPEMPGSFSHFYDTMSFGKLQVRGEVAPRVYESAQPASAYLENDQTPEEDFGRFSLEILRQADREIDFAQFDNDGPDGVPNSGDDDGVVDAVFMVLGRVSADFLVAEATGVARLGFTEVFFSSDTDKKGKTIQVFPGQGTIQQGRNFSEAVGVMCHEYGHVLGLPDLYNTEFIAKEGAGPEEDSAGVGAWCLMGWGATGWNGNDGPNSFCAWSRMKLGWAEAKEMEDANQELSIGAVGQQGQILKVPLTGQEYFLAEYRRRTANYYDRHIPAEGLLIWHVGTWRRENALASEVVVDLECADGRWQEAGYPLGRTAAALRGGDNLDFWAHDEEYSRAHGGNLGDATDPFDGVRFRSFTPESNPDSYSNDQHRSVRLEDIRLEEGRALVKVHTEPLMLEVDRLRLRPLVAGEEYQVEFRLNNRGGVLATNLRVELSTQDNLVEILQAEARFRDLEVEQSSMAGPLEGVYPRLRFREDFAGTHEGRVSLDVYAGEELVAQKPFSLVAVSLHQSISQTALIDTAGNRDGKAQGGEFIQLGLEVDVEDPGLLSLLDFNLRPLDQRVHPVGGPEVFFSAALGRRVRGPEFLLSSDLEPGTLLPFVFESRRDTRVWQDTLWVGVEAGGDQTPPRVSGPVVAVRKGVMEISLLEQLILEGGSLRSVSAQIYRSADTTLVATVPMAAEGGRYTGTWPGAGEGYYMVQVVAVDQAGNLGLSPLKWHLLLSAGQAVPERATGFLGKGTAYEALYSPDGQLLAVSSSGGIWLYETATFQEVGFLEVMYLDLLSSPALAISPDSQVLASGDSEGAIQLWDLRTQQEIDRLEGTARRVTGLRFSPDGRLLYSAGSDERVRIWDLAEPAEVEGLEGDRMGISAIELSPDGTLLAAGNNSVIRIWEVSQRQVISSIEDRGRVSDLAFSPDGKMLAVAEGYNVRLWDMAQGLALGVLKNPHSVNSLAFSPDGQTLALGGTQGVDLWEVQGQRLLDTIGDNKWVGAVSFSPDGGFLAFPQDEEVVQVWDLRAQQTHALLKGFGRRFIADLAFSPDGRTLAAGEWGWVVRLWDMVDQSEIGVLKSGGPVLAFNPDGRFLASSGDDNKVWLLDAQGREKPALIEAGEGRVLDVAFHPDGNLLAVAGYPNVLRLWDLGRQQYHWYFSDQAAGGGLAFSPDGRFLATFGPAESAVWEVATQQEVSAFKRLKDISALSFSPDGRWLVLGSKRGLVHLVEVGSMLEVDRLEGSGSNILKLAFSPDSQLLAGGTLSGRIALWELGPRRLVSTLKGRFYGVGGLAFSPDGHVLASGGLDGIVRLWQSMVPTEVEQQTAAPQRFSLSPNYPNPFNPTTTLRFSLPQAGDAELSVYNLVGQRVATLVKGMQEAGPHTLQWNGLDDAGRELASGVYFYRLQAGVQVETRKLLLLR